MENNVPPFRAERSGLDVPFGPYDISYDLKDDLLWIGRSCVCTGDQCIHGTGKIVQVEENVLVTVNGRRSRHVFVSSFALQHASSHPLWSRLFGALDKAAQDRARVTLSFPCRWFSEAI